MKRTYFRLWPFNIFIIGIFYVIIFLEGYKKSKQVINMGEIILRIPEDIKIEYDIKDSNDLGQSVEKIKKYLKFKMVFNKLKSSVESDLTRKDIKEMVYE